MRERGRDRGERVRDRERKRERKNTLLRNNFSFKLNHFYLFS